MRAFPPVNEALVFLSRVSILDPQLPEPVWNQTAIAAAL